MELYYVISQDLKNSFFDFLMPFITDPKNWFTPVLIALLIFFLAQFWNRSNNGWLNSKKMFLTLALVALAVGIGDYTNHNVWKPLFGRARPCNMFPHIKTLFSCSSSFSFPSSHAVNIFSIATIVSWHFRISTVFMTAIAFLVCYSRVYVGVHYPLDVTAGALYGIFCGSMVIFIEELYLKKRQSKN